MKYITLIFVGLFIAGCVEANSPLKYNSENIAEPNWTITRTVDEQYKVVCYTHSKNISCVKL